MPAWRRRHLSRTCPSYSPIWAGDVRVKLFAALRAYGQDQDAKGRRGQVRMITVTGPGVDAGYPWDEDHCAHLGPHRHSGHLGCRVAAAPAAVFNERAPGWWSHLHREARQAAKRTALIAPELLARIWEEQKRGLLHVHLVVGYTTLAERRAVDLYVRELFERSEGHGFGYVDRKLEVKDPTAAAAYLSSYFVSGKKGKLSLTESVQSEAMPRSIIYVAPWLSQRSGITMRSLRLKRYAWRLWRQLAGQMGGVAPLSVDEMWFGLCEGWDLARIAHEFF